MMIERLNGRTSVAIAAVGLLLVVLVGWFGVVSPQRTKAADLAVRIDETEARLTATQALVRGPLLRQSTAELATLRKAIPDEVKMSQLLRQLSKASAESRVRILGITPAEVVSVGGADAIAMNIAIEGRYFGIRNFLRLLREGADIRSDKVRASGRLFAIEAISFSGASGETSGNLIQANLTVNAFAFSGAAPVAVAGGSSAGVADSEPAAEAATP